MTTKKINYNKYIYNKIQYANTNIKVLIVNNENKLNNYYKNNNYDKIILFPNVYDDRIIELFESNKIDGIILPHVTFDKDIDIIKNIVSKTNNMIVISNNLGHIEALKDKCILWAGIGMNAINNYAVNFLYKIGIDTVISAIESKNCLKNTISVKEGYIPTMNFAFCPKSISIGCSKCMEKSIVDNKGNDVIFNCVRIYNKSSFILEKIKNKNGNIISDIYD